METPDRTPLVRSTWWPIGVSAAIFVWWVVAVARLAIPRYDICAAIYPAPAGCAAAGRTTTAVIAVVVMLALFVGLLWVARRFSANPASAWIATVVFAIAAVVTYRVILY